MISGDRRIRRRLTTLSEHIGGQIAAGGTQAIEALRLVTGGEEISPRHAFAVEADLVEAEDVLHHKGAVGDINDFRDSHDSANAAFEPGYMDDQPDAGVALKPP